MPAAAISRTLAVRWAACYLLPYALLCGNVTVWQCVPGVGLRLERAAARLLLRPAQWVAVHGLHWTGEAVQLHRGASGDRALDWLAAGLLLVASLLVAAGWTWWVERAGEGSGWPILWRSLPKGGVSGVSPTGLPEDARVGWWLELGLRLALAAALLQYGWVKVFPLQMPGPSLAVLNEPLGQVSPMTLVWTLVGVSPAYEIVCGVVEVLAGVLLLFRRTQAAGALLCLVVMTQVMLYNLFLDVPLKLYTAHLLGMAGLLLAPAWPRLRGVLWRPEVGEPMPGGGGAFRARVRPPRGFRWAERGSQVVLLVMLGVLTPWRVHAQYAAERRAVAHPSADMAALVGVWRLQPPPALSLRLDHGPWRMPNGSALAELTMEPTGRLALRGADGELWRASPHLDETGRTLTIAPYAGPAVCFAYTLPDRDHLLLTPTGRGDAGAPQLALTRTAAPGPAPLLERGFHWVNEWGYER